MHTDHLLAFEQIAALGNFSRAAQALDIAQPTISARIRALESEVGGALFVRGGRGVTLTPLGEGFLPFARRALQVLEEGREAARLAAEGQGGRVTVGVIESLTGGCDVYLRDIWPSQAEIRDAVAESVTPEMFTKQYGNVYDGNEEWNQIAVSGGALYEWDENSTYIQHPPFFQDLSMDLATISEIEGARALLLLGDSITTDHISPAGAIAVKSPAGQYLIENGVAPPDFNSYGSRRGNHEVMMRGTFANVRIKNQLLPGTEGPRTLHLDSGEEGWVYDVAMRYQEEGTPLVVLAGKEYGTGSSRDWAAKGTYLLGVKAVIAESYERIHRSNLIGMGVLPLQFVNGEGWSVLGLTGREHFDILGLSDGMAPGALLDVTATRDDGSAIQFQVKARLDTPVEINYLRNGGILHTVLRGFMRKGQ